MFMRRYTDKFAELFTDDKVHLVQDAIDTTYNLWLGIDDVFPAPEKAREVYGLLVAWTLCDFYPEYTFGVANTGGGYIRGKKIGGVDIQYNVSTRQGITQDLLSALDTNIFGKRAKMMLGLSNKRLGVFA